MTEAISGLFGGCAGLLVGHPFDTVKVKLQTQDFRNPKYNGTFDCFRKTIRRNGVRSLYSGIASPLAGVGGINAIIFGVQGYTNRLFPDQNALSSHFYAGMCAGFAQSFICSPVELTKTLLQLQSDKGGPAKYRGTLDCLSQIYKARGLRGVFKGQVITIMRETPAFGTYFLSYETLTRLTSGAETSMGAGSGAILLSGGLAGMCSWFISYPVDVIKSRLQSDGFFGAAKYSGILDCVKKSLREEGVRVFFRGLNSTMIRAFPTNAATFFVISCVTKLLLQFEDCIEEMSSGDKMKSMAQGGERIIANTKEIHNGYTYQHDSFQKLQDGNIAKLIPSMINSTRQSLNYCHNEFWNLIGGEGQDIDTYRALKGMLHDQRRVRNVNHLPAESRSTTTVKHQLLSNAI